MSLSSSWNYGNSEMSHAEFINSYQFTNLAAWMVSLVDAEIPIDDLKVTLVNTGIDKCEFLGDKLLNYQIARVGFRKQGISAGMVQAKHSKYVSNAMYRKILSEFAEVRSARGPDVLECLCWVLNLYDTSVMKIAEFIVDTVNHWNLAEVSEMELIAHNSRMNKRKGTHSVFAVKHTLDYKSAILAVSQSYSMRLVQSNSDDVLFMSVIYNEESLANACLPAHEYKDDVQNIYRALAEDMIRRNPDHAVSRLLLTRLGSTE